MPRSRISSGISSRVHAKAVSRLIRVVRRQSVVACVDDVADAMHPGVGHQHVDPAKAVSGQLQRQANIARIGRIPHRQQATQPDRHGLERFFAAPHQHHPATDREKRSATAAPMPAPR